MKYKNVVSLFSVAVIAGLSYMLYIRRYDVSDWLVLRNYEPSSSVESLASRAQLNDYGRRLFYVHDPSLLKKDNFQGKCSNDEATIVLGCYISHDKIYVFDVDDDRLEGVEEVTAAHEMLHAAYDRLSTDEKDELNVLLQTTFNELDNQRIIDTVNSYEQKDPSVVTNELHSILATEVRELPKELEEHYSQYFIDRLIVVEKAEAYASAFTARIEKIQSLDEQLNQLKAEIEIREADLNQLTSGLNQERQQLDNSRSNPQEYNSRVPVYNSKVRQYNNELQAVRALIDRFNVIVSERNTIAIEERELVEAIDTRVREL